MPTLADQLKDKLAMAAMPGRLYLGERDMQTVIAELERLTSELAAVSAVVAAAVKIDQTGFMPVIEASQALPGSVIAKFSGGNHE